MPTVDSKKLVDEIIAKNGLYPGDPQIYRITEYDNAGGGKSYGLDYDLQTMYHPSPYVVNPKVIWEFKG